MTKESSHLGRNDSELSLVFGLIWFLFDLLELLLQADNLGRAQPLQLPLIPSFVLRFLLQVTITIGYLADFQRILP